MGGKKYCFWLPKLSPAPMGALLVGQAGVSLLGNMELKYGLGELLEQKADGSR